MATAQTGPRPFLKASEMQQFSYPWSSRARWALCAVLLLGLALRLVDFPTRHEIRDVDEITYIENGMLVWEGVSPAAAGGVDGPETWMSWAYMAGDTAWKFVRPPAGQVPVPLQIRPFMAVDRALFDTYADMSSLHRYMLCLQLLIGLGAIYAAFRLGWHFAGWAGGIVVGTVVACLPLYIEFAAMTRPYSDGWAFGLMALAAAAIWRGRRRAIGAGILLGLSVAARIDMLMIVPLIAWILWHQREPRSPWRMALQFLGVAAVTTMLADPWLLQQLFGTLRTIATIRFSDQFSAGSTSPKLDTLWSLAVQQGLALFLLLALAGLFLTPAQERRKAWVLAILTFLFVSTMFSGQYKPMRYHGAPVLAILLLGAVMLGQLMQHRPKVIAVLGALVLLLPLVQGVRQARLGAMGHPVQDDAIAWLETHVPAGTIVYVVNQSMETRVPLPTAQAADALWAEVTNSQAWRSKFQRGLKRFHLDADEIPRALSELNLTSERGSWRRWFILGSQTRTTRPRYDIRVALSSPTFGIQDLPQEFAKTGGIILITRADTDINVSLNGLTPLMRWVDSRDQGKLLYCSADVQARLVNMP